MENENKETTENISKLNLIIKGLAICHFNGGQGIWKVFFPSVNDHAFKLKITKKIISKEQDSTIFHLPPATEINFSQKASSQVSTMESTKWVDSIDLGELHEEPVHLVPDKEKYAGIFTINGATLGSEKVKYPEVFEIWDARTKQKNWIKDIEPANVFSSFFQFDSDVLIDIKLFDGYDINLVLKQEKDVSYIVEFFNNCKEEEKGCDMITDFSHLYDIIDETKFSTKRRFEMLTLEDGRGTSGSRCGGIKSDNLVIPDSW